MGTTIISMVIFQFANRNSHYQRLNFHFPMVSCGFPMVFRLVFRFQTFHQNRSVEVTSRTMRITSGMRCGVVAAACRGEDDLGRRNRGDVFVELKLRHGEPQDNHGKTIAKWWFHLI